MSFFKTSLKPLIDKGYAKIKHTHGNITEDGKITGQASKNVVTDANGNITTENKPTIDSSLSTTSTNAVQNKVINTALGNKVDKETGKGLSTNDYTTTEKNKLAGIATSANNYSHPSSHPATMITDATAHSNIGSSANATQASINTSIDTALSNKQAKGSYAAASHTHDDRYYTESEMDTKLTAKAVTLTKLETATTGYIATYEIKQGTTSLGKIDIPKDYLVKSGSVKSVTTANNPVSGYAVGDKYIDFVINTKDSSGTNEHVYINVKDLIDAYTAGTGLELSNSNQFSVKYGNAAGTACQGNDSRLSNARTPTAHATNSTTYGAGSTSNYGHVKLIENLTTNAGDGLALGAGQGKALKTLVDAKVNTSDIKDNLTSTDTNKPLSAAQGKELKTQIDNIVSGTTATNHNHDNSYAAKSHTHGNITNAGAIGSTANLPIITDTNGVLKAGSFGTAANTFCQGNDSRLSNARTPTAHTDSNGAYGKATTSVWGHTKLNSATNSTDETTAATPKAVKTAYDLANGKANASHTHADNQITLTSSAANAVTPLDMAIGEIFNANRLAYLPPANITIKYSTNNGSTWTDYGTTNENKANLVSADDSNKVFFIAGKNATASTNNQLLIDIDAGGGDLTSSNSNVYMVLRKIMIYFSTGGGGNCKVTVQTATYVAPTTFTTKGTYDLGGYSGWNSIPLNITFGGFKNQTDHIKYVRFIFYRTSDAKNFNVQNIRFFGETAWIIPSNMAKYGHIYSYDINQNATFPGKIIKSGGTNTQLLLANGDTKATTDFAVSGHYHNGQAYADNIVAGENLTSGGLIFAKSNGNYYNLNSKGLLDVSYPIYKVFANVNSGNASNNVDLNQANLPIATTKNITLTANKPVYIEGSSYSKGQFQIQNEVTQTLTNGCYYIKLGTAFSTAGIRFISDTSVYYYDGVNLKPVNNIDDETGGINLLTNTQSYGTGTNGSLTGEFYKGCAVRRYNNTSGSTYVDCSWGDTPKIGEFKQGDTYTLSFWAKGTGQIICYSYGYSGYCPTKPISSNGTNSSTYGDGNCAFNLTSDWKRYYVTWVLDPSANDSSLNVSKTLLIRTTKGSDSYVAGVMFERGSVPHDWSLNPLENNANKIVAGNGNTKNLNDYIVAGFYYNDNNTSCGYISNLPESSKAFFLLVESWGASNYTKQTVTHYGTNNTYTRIRNAGTWGAWKEISANTNTTYTASDGVKLDGTTFKHDSGTGTAQTTKSVYSIKFDKFGHINEATAVSSMAPTAHTNATGSNVGQATASLFGHAKAFNGTTTAIGTSASNGTDNGIYARGDHTHNITKATITGLGISSSDHTHSYLPLGGGTLTGNVSSNSKISTTNTIDAKEGNLVYNRIHRDTSTVEYIKMLQITLSGSHYNVPISFTIDGRGKPKTNIQILFTDASSASASAIDKVYYDGYPWNVYVYKSASLTYQVIIQKTAYDDINITNLQYNRTRATDGTHNITITTLSEALTSLPPNTTDNPLVQAIINPYYKDTNTIYANGTGITIGSGNAINHSNSVAAQSTQALYKIKHDAQGHITASTLVGVDGAVTQNSGNLVSSGAVWAGLNGKADSGHTHSYLSTASYSNGTLTIQ